jgi:hypothetical protein
MKIKIGFLAVIPISLAVLLTGTQAQGNQPQLVAHLEPMLEKCDWKVRNLTGGPKGVMLLHQAKMRRILSELKAGRSVEPKKIEEIIKEHAS